MKPFIIIFCLIACCSADVSVSTSSYGKTYAPGDLIFQDEFDSLNTNTWHHEIYMDTNNGEFQIYDDYNENAYVRDGVLYIKPSLTVDTIFGGNYEKQFNGYLALDGYVKFESQFWHSDNFQGVVIKINVKIGANWHNCTDPNGPGSSNCARQGQYPYILPPVTSARLRTKGSFSFKYGRVEVRAKMPAGDWTWPAIWLLPEDNKYGGWPASGEIDMVESRGNRQLFDNNGVNIGTEQVGSTLHFGPNWPYDSWWAGHGQQNSAPGNGYDVDFHLYQVEWTPTYLKFSLDNVELKTVTPPAGGFYALGQFPSNTNNPWTNADNPKMAPFDQNFHFILNNAVGGMFFPDDAKGPYPRPWPPGSQTPFRDFLDGRANWEPTWQGENHAMKVDYVRVYAI